MTNNEFRAGLENLILIANCALEDFERQIIGNKVRMDIGVHLKDLHAECAELLNALKEEGSK